MRTKTLCALAAVAAIAIPASAQVYSANIVGYVNQSVAGPSLFTMVANPFNTGANGADVVLPAVESSQVLKWNGIAFNTFFYDSGFGGWVDDGFNPSVPSLPVGEGFFYYNPNPTTTLTFVGEVAAAPGASVTNVLAPNAFNLVGGKIPFGGAMDSTSVNVPVQESMQILKWNGATGYFLWFYDSGFGGWIDDGFNPVAAPTLSPGEGFFYYNPSTSAANWVQTLP